MSSERPKRDSGHLVRRVTSVPPKGEIPSHERIKALAEGVAHEHEDLETAIAEGREAEKDLFKELLKAVQPALVAITHKVKIAETGKFTPDGRYKALTTKWSDAAYFLLSGEVEEPTKEPPRGTEGKYTGAEYFISSAGDLYLCEYAGSWCLGGESSWTSTWQRVDSSLAIRGRRALQTYTARVEDELERQIGSREFRVNQFKAEADGIRAVLSLLKLVKK